MAKRVNIAGREHTKDKTLTAVLTASSWLLGQLPHRVRQDQRGALVKALHQATNLAIEVHPATAEILVRDGSNPLLRFSARP